MTRLPTGGLIDRSRPLRFTFDGRSYSGFQGDTLASALLANGVRIVGRSFKYHRPRGILTAGAEEPNALVTIGAGDAAIPNMRATTVPLAEGLVAHSQNRWPSLRFDLLAINQWFAPLLGAGFYYKTFMWPAAFWERLYEPLIRRAAGLGKLMLTPDPAVYDREHGFCDLLVIGGGAAGLAAALTAGRAGLRVILADQDERPGGSLLGQRMDIDGISGVAWATKAHAELATMPDVQILPRTAVFGAYDGHVYGAIQTLADGVGNATRRQRYWKIVAPRVILASGAIERPLIFAGNDRPGVMMAGAVSAYINRYAVAPGRRAVVYTSCDSGWDIVDDLRHAGVELAAVIDTRSDAPQAAAARERGAIVHAGARVIAAHGCPVRQVEIETCDGRRMTVKADLLAMAGGWNPAIGIGGHLGDAPRWCDDGQTFLLDNAPPGLVPAGAAAGRLTLRAALTDGVERACDAITALGRPLPPPPHFEALNEAAAIGAHPPPRGNRGKAFVDFQHDVTDADVTLAAREGFVSVEHLKRYTTLGMATDQGKTSQINGHALLAAATGRRIEDVGTIRSRPPWQPVAVGAFAGFHREADFRPERRTASHEWAARQGAQFVDAGQWKRAQWFEQPGEKHWRESVDREVRAARSGVGLCDVSTLGKIEVHGADAGQLLDHLYINGFSALAVGKARYGVMLREDGFVFDDGTVTRFADDHYYVTTTTANAARVMQHIDFARQVLWPQLDVQAVSVTEQWATYAVAGPRSRDVIAKLLPDLDMSNAAFPFMAAAQCRWQGYEARLFRVSFSGELAYEIAVPAQAGEALVGALMLAGAAFGITPYGTEALSVMRIEKGHAAGGELNGQTSAADLGMGRMMSTKKDFVGRVMGERPALNAPDRPRLVGLKPTDSRSAIRAGAHLLDPGKIASAAHDQGYVTSAAFSPTLDSPIALALLRHGPERHGDMIIVHDPVRGDDVEALVCNPLFYDPDGVKVRG
jgi:methylglutamate dehydrogenase subunit C